MTDRDIIRDWLIDRKIDLHEYQKHLDVQHEKQPSGMTRIWRREAKIVCDWIEVMFRTILKPD